MAQWVKNLPARQETQVQSLGWEDRLEEGMAIHSSILAWTESHGQRSLAGYSPWGHKELDMTEVTEHAQAPNAVVVWGPNWIQSSMKQSPHN